MSGRHLSFLLAVLPLLAFPHPAGAHHPPRFERCQMFAFTGEIQRIDWINPHVRLTIRADDGRDFELAWLSPRALRRVDIGMGVLKAGDRVVVEGGFRTKDAENAPLLLNGIQKTDDDWAWMQPLQGC